MKKTYFSFVLLGLVALVPVGVSAEVAPSGVPYGCLFGYNFSPITGARCPVSTTPILPAPICVEPFSRNLTIGSYGQDVVKLHQILQKEGFGGKAGIPEDGDPNYRFDEITASFVVKFQAKYGILQTGYVGPITRAKLNSLYHCDDTPTPGNQAPVINGISGPTTLRVGQTGTWTINAYDPENGPLTYSVYWGDEVQKVSAGALPSASQQTTTFRRSFAHSGVYTSTFVVRDNAGNEVQTTMSVNVGDVSGGKISIAYTNDQKEVYTPGQTIKVYVKGVKPDGTLTVPEEGFNLQAHIFDSARTETYQGVNGTYNPSSGLWEAVLTAPTDPKVSYDLELVVYCSNHRLSCVNYGTGYYDQAMKVLKFKVSSADEESSISIENPRGGETWREGNTYTIRWSGNTNRDSLDLFLWKADNTVGYSNKTFGHAIVRLPNAAESGEYRYTLRKSDVWNNLLPKDSDYTIRIHKSNVNTFVESRQFSVLPLVSAIDPNINVNFPNGGENIVHGATVDIKWNKNFDAGNHPTYIDLIGSRGHFSKIASLDGSATSYRWTVPSNLPVDTYRIRVAVCPEESVSGYNCYDESNRLFNIIARPTRPFAQITSPNGGESYNGGDRITVRWNTAGQDLNVTHIALVNANGGFLRNLVTDLPSSQTSVDVNIPMDIATGQYKIRAILCPKNYYAPTSGEKCSDDSDGTITIAGGVAYPH